MNCRSEKLASKPRLRMTSHTTRSMYLHPTDLRQWWGAWRSASFGKCSFSLFREDAVSRHLANMTLYWAYRTYFPYPITTRTTLRKDLGATLYLLANFYSAVHSTIDMRLHMGIKGRSGDKNSPLNPLDKARHKCFNKCLIMLNRLREHSNFTKFDPTFGGPFPKAVSFLFSLHATPTAASTPAPTYFEVTLMIICL